MLCEPYHHLSHVISQEVSLEDICTRKTENPLLRIPSLLWKRLTNGTFHIWTMLFPIPSCTYVWYINISLQCASPPILQHLSTYTTYQRDVVHWNWWWKPSEQLALFNALLWLMFLMPSGYHQSHSSCSRCRDTLLAIQGHPPWWGHPCIGNYEAVLLLMAAMSTVIMHTCLSTWFAFSPLFPYNTCNTSSSIYSSHSSYTIRYPDVNKKNKHGKKIGCFYVEVCTYMQLVTLSKNESQVKSSNAHKKVMWSHIGKCEVMWWSVVYLQRSHSLTEVKK